jgi:hypothetical protein
MSARPLERDAHQGIDANVAQRQARAAEHRVALEFLAHAVDVQTQRRIALAAVGHHAAVAGWPVARQAGGVHIRDRDPAQQLACAIAGQASHGARPRLHACPAAGAHASAIRARGAAASGWSCACPRSRSRS